MTSQKYYESNGDFWAVGNTNLYHINRNGDIIKKLPYDPVTENTGFGSSTIASSSNSIVHGFSISDLGINENGYIRYYNQYGSLLWSKKILSWRMSITDIAVNEKGTVFFTGYFIENMEFEDIKWENETSDFYAAFDNEGNLLFFNKISAKVLGVEIDVNDQANFAFYTTDLYDDGIVRLLPAHTNIIKYNESSADFELVAYDMDSYQWFDIDDQNNFYLVKAKEVLKLTKINASNIIQWNKELISTSAGFANIQLYNDQIILIARSSLEEEVSTLVIDSNGNLLKVAKMLASATSINDNGELILYNHGFDYYLNLGFQNVKITIK